MATAPDRPMTGNGVAADAPTPALKFVERSAPQHPDDLSDIDAAQLRLAGKLYDGQDLPANERVRTADMPEDSEEGLAYLERWDVHAEGDEDTVLYDAWLYMVDSGVVYRHGTTQVVSEVIQFGFDPPGSGEQVPADLPEALSTAYSAARLAARTAAAVAAEA